VHEGVEEAHAGGGVRGLTEETGRETGVEGCFIGQGCKDIKILGKAMNNYAQLSRQPSPLN
jgi:hypothetical protein